jgi:hypothetical protein
MFERLKTAQPIPRNLHIFANDFLFLGMLYEFWMRSGAYIYK